MNENNEAYYELTLLVSDKKKDTISYIVERVLEAILPAMANACVYEGYKTLAYKINNEEKAHYYWMRFCLTREQKNKLCEVLNEEDSKGNLMRYLFVVSDPEKVRLRQ